MLDKVYKFMESSVRRLWKSIQKILNFVARVISWRRKCDHISPVLNQLGWLNSEELVQYYDLRILDKSIAIETPSSLALRVHFKKWAS